MKIDRRQFLEEAGKTGAALVLLSVLPGCESFDISEGTREFAFLTPQDEWFWFSGMEDTPSRAPNILPDDWTLEIRSGGRSVGEIGFRKLKALEADGLDVQYLKTMRCIFGTLADELSETLTATGVFRGIPLSIVLDETDISGEATKLKIDASDGFSTSLSYDRLIDETQLPVILAYELNGEPLTRERGGPVRLIVPESWGFKSIKWISTVDATTDFSSYGTFETGPFAGKTIVDNPGAMPLTTLLNDPPSLLAEVAGPDVALRGMALVGGTKVDAVEVQIDEGDWQLATIAPFDDVLDSLGHDALLVRSSVQYGEDWPYPNVWAPWSFTAMGLTPGRHRINLRSVDRTGRSNPSIVNEPYETTQHIALELDVT